MGAGYTHVFFNILPHQTLNPDDVAHANAWVVRPDGRVHPTFDAPMPIRLDGVSLDAGAPYENPQATRRAKAYSSQSTGVVRKRAYRAR